MDNKKIARELLRLAKNISTRNREAANIKVYPLVVNIDSVDYNEVIKFLVKNNLATSEKYVLANETEQESDDWDKSMLYIPAKGDLKHGLLSIRGARSSRQGTLAIINTDQGKMWEIWFD